MNCLLDNMNCEGTLLSEYMNAAEKIDGCTAVKDIDTDEIRLLCFCDYTSRHLIMRVLDGQYEVTPGGSIVFGQRLKLNTEDLNASEKSIIEELVRKRESIFSIYTNVAEKSRKYYFIAETLYKTLAACQSGLGGKFLKSPGFVRDMALCQELQESGVKYHALIRREGKLLKIFALYRQKTDRFPFAELGKIAEGGKVTEWSITQQKAELMFEIPEFCHGDAVSGIRNKNGLMMYPLILLRTSDTGYYATTASAVWKYGNTDPGYYFVQKTWNLTGDTDYRKLLSDISREQLTWFEKFDARFADETDTADMGKVFGLTGAVGVGAARTLKNNLKKLNRKEGIIYLLKDAEKELTPYQKTQYQTVLQNFVTV